MSVFSRWPVQMLANYWSPKREKRTFSQTSVHWEEMFCSSFLPFSVWNGQHCQTWIISPTLHKNTSIIWFSKKMDMLLCHEVFLFSYENERAESKVLNLSLMTLSLSGQRCSVFVWCTMSLLKFDQHFPTGWNCLDLGTYSHYSMLKTHHLAFNEVWFWYRFKAQLKQWWEEGNIRQREIVKSLTVLGWSLTDLKFQQLY